VDPAFPQPARRVEAGRIAIHQQGVAVARDPAQHGVYQALQVMQAGILDQAHRCVDRGVRRRAEEHQLGGAQAQYLAADRVRAVEGLGDQAGQYALDLAQVAHGGGQQQADEGAVARIEGGEAAMAGQRVVERLALVETGHQHIDCGAAGSERGSIHRAAL
jgi:hypothetical protein